MTGKLILRPLLGLIFALAAMTAQAAFSTVENLGSGSERTTLQNGKIYMVRSTVTLKGEGSTPALSVADNSTVVICILKNVELILKGVDGNGTTAGLPALYVPSSSTLIVTGDGTLSATGGKAGDAGDGATGGDGDIYDYTWSNGAGRAGTGGKGGGGGGGAGAGIGGKGGKGGTGGDGKGGFDGRCDDTSFIHDGNAGNDGDDGNNGTACGTVYVLGTVTMNATGGAAGDAGDGGGHGSHEYYYWTYNYIAGAGGGGGGGGKGGGARSIGGGGCGGGGGGGGGGGMTHYAQSCDWDDWNSFWSAVGGKGGGGGGQDGEKGADCPVTGMAGRSDKWAAGGAGGSGGDSGSTGGNGTVYASSGATLPSDVTGAGKAESHSTIEYTVSIYGDSGSESASQNVTLGCAAQLPKLKSDSGWKPLGYYTKPKGGGEKLFNADGSYVNSCWDRADDVIVYPHYEFGPAAQAFQLTVNSSADVTEYRYDDDVVSLREALIFAYEHPDAVASDGTRTISFAANNGNPFTVALNRSIELSGINVTIRGRADSLTTLKTNAPEDDDFFVFRASSNVRFVDLQFDFYVDKPYYANRDYSIFASPVGSTGLVVCENCRFRYYSACEGCVLMSYGSCRFRFVDCSFAESVGYYASVCRIENKGTLHEDVAVFVHSTFAGCRSVGWTSNVANLVYNKSTVAADDKAVRFYGCTYFNGDNNKYPCVKSNGRVDELFISSACVNDRTLANEPITDPNNFATGTTRLFVRAVPHDVVEPIRYSSAAGKGSQVYHSADWATVSTSPGSGLVRKATDEIGNAIPESTATSRPCLGSVVYVSEASSLKVDFASTTSDPCDGKTTLFEAIRYANLGCKSTVGEDGRITVDCSRLAAAGPVEIPVAETITVSARANTPLALASSAAVTLRRTGADVAIFDVVTPFECRDLTFASAANLTNLTRPYVACRANSSLFVSNCVFNCSSDKPSAAAITADGAERTVILRSTFEASGRGLALTAKTGLVAESTIADGAAPSFSFTERGAVVASTFHPAKIEGDLSKTTVEGCIFGIASTDDTPFESVAAGFVTHRYYRLASTSEYRAGGVFLWHDAAWQNLALSTTRSSEKTAVAGFGNPALADAVFDIDITGERITSAQNFSGSYVPAADPCRLQVTDVGDDDVDEPNASDSYDGVNTLRECLLRAEDDPSLANPNGRREITFDTLAAPSGSNPVTITLKQDVLLAGTGLTNGLAVVGRTDRQTKIVGSGNGKRFLTIKGDVRLHFKDLVFANFDTAIVESVAGNSGLVVFENCLFTDCTGGLLLAGGDCRFRFVDCDFQNLSPTSDALVHVTGGVPHPAADLVAFVHSTFCEILATDPGRGALSYVEKAAHGGGKFYPVKFYGCSYRQREGTTAAAFASEGFASLLAGAAISSVVEEDAGFTAYPHDAYGAMHYETRSYNVRAIPHAVWHPVSEGAADGTGALVYRSADWATVSTSPGAGLDPKTTDETGAAFGDSPICRGAMGRRCEKPSLRLSSEPVESGVYTVAAVDPFDGLTSMTEALRYANTGWPTVIGEDGKITITSEHLYFAIRGSFEVNVKGGVPLKLIGDDPQGGSIGFYPESNRSSPVFRVRTPLELEHVGIMDPAPFENYDPMIICEAGSSLTLMECDVVHESIVFGRNPRNSLIRANNCERFVVIGTSLHTYYGRVFDVTAKTGVIAESTVAELQFSRMHWPRLSFTEKGLVVGSTFGLSESDCGIDNAHTRVVSCVFSAENGANGTVQKGTFGRGVGNRSPRFYSPVVPGTLAGHGMFLWHDEEYENLALSVTRYSEKQSVSRFGDPECATILHDRDVTGYRIGSTCNSVGSYVPPTDACRLVVTDGGDELFRDELTASDDYDGVYTLRECLLRAEINPGLANSGRREITFDDSLLPEDGDAPLAITLANEIPLCGTGLSNGVAIVANTNRPTRIVGPYDGNRFLDIMGDVRLHFKDLSFDKFGGGPDNLGGGLVLSQQGDAGLVVFENCRISNNEAGDGTEASMGGLLLAEGGCGFRFVDCNFNRISSSVMGNVVVDMAKATLGAGDIAFVHSTFGEVYSSAYATLVYLYDQPSSTKPSPVRFYGCTYKNVVNGAPVAFATSGAASVLNAICHSTVLEGDDKAAYPHDRAGTLSAATTNIVVRGVSHDVWLPTLYGDAQNTGGQVYHSPDWATVSAEPGAGLVRKETDEVGNSIPESGDARFALCRGAVVPPFDKPRTSVSRDDMTVDPSDGEISIAEAFGYMRHMPEMVVDESTGTFTVDFAALSAYGLHDVRVDRTLGIDDEIKYPVRFVGNEAGVTLVRTNCAGRLVEAGGSKAKRVTVENLSFADAPDATGARAALVAATGSIDLRVSNVALRSGATLAEGGDEKALGLYAACGKCIVEGSSFVFPNANALDVLAKKSVVTECTVDDAAPSLFGREGSVAVACVENTFAGAAPEFRSTVTNGCILGRDHLLSGGWDGFVRTARHVGVDQVYYRPNRPGPFAGTGVNLWHDAEWDNLATNEEVTGPKTSIWGGVNSAKTRVDRDVRGVLISADHNSVGSYAWEPDGLDIHVVTVPYETGEIPNNADGVVSLRESVWAPYYKPELNSGYTTTFAPSLYANGPARCLLDSELIVCSRISINGPSPELVTIDAQKRGRVLRVTSDRFKLSGVTVTGGLALSDSGAAIQYLTSGYHDVTDCVFADNHSGHGGGAIDLGRWPDNDCRILRCRFERNISDNGAGAIVSYASGYLKITDSSFGFNTGATAGAVDSCCWTDAGCRVSVLRSTFVGNESTLSPSTGGLRLGFIPNNLLKHEVINCTFRSNRAASGFGGVWVNSDTHIDMINCVATGNKAGQGNQDVGMPGSNMCTIRGLVACAPTFTTESSETYRIFVGEPTYSDKNVFANSEAGTTMIQVGLTKQYVEPLKNKSYNYALTGYETSVFDYRTDITGRTFDHCQMGSFWCQTETPSLVAGALSDESDPTDGQLTLREILEGIAAGKSAYTRLASGGVYNITFKDGLEGPLLMSGSQYEIDNLNGKVVSIDGGGRVQIVGTSVMIEKEDEDEDDSPSRAITNSFRAFAITRGNELRLKNLDFIRNVGLNHGSILTAGYDGGAILNLGTLVAENCTFSSCSAGEKFENPTGNGGAVCNGSRSVTGAKATLKNCTFESCRANRGGAVYNYRGNEVAVSGGGFASNAAGGGTAIMNAVGGAIVNEADAALSFSGATFDGNTVTIDGCTGPSDVFDLSKDYYSVTFGKSGLAVQLNELATPELTDGDAELDLVSDENTVSVDPGNVKPGLYYGLGHADYIGGEFKVDKWVRAGEDGRLPESLVAPKASDSGFYRVFVSIEDPTGR